MSRRRWVLGGLAAGVALIALGAALWGDTPWGYVPNWATRRKAWGVDLRRVTHVEMTGPYLRREGKRWALRDRRAIARLLDAFRRSCRPWREEHLRYSAADHVLFCYGNPRIVRATGFEFNSLDAREQRGPAVESAVAPYLNDPRHWRCRWLTFTRLRDGRWWVCAFSRLKGLKQPSSFVNRSLQRLGRKTQPKVGV